MSIYTSKIDDFWWDVTFRKVVLCRLDSIGFGLFFAWIYFYYYKTWIKIKLPAFITGILLIVFILNYHSPPNSIYKQNIYFSLVPFAVMLFLPIAESCKKGKGIFSIGIQHISKISYSMYLINLALVAEVIRTNAPPIGGIDGILKYLLYWTIVILASTILFRYFEKPIMNLRDEKLKIRFLAKNKK
tara:strand:- start:97 stop:657 length:561 start_codon:yes stop_codon:yes gene_type:complete